jgi:hypothetical protein
MAKTALSDADPAQGIGRHGQQAANNGTTPGTCNIF